MKSLATPATTVAAVLLLSCCGSVDSTTPATTHVRPKTFSFTSSEQYHIFWMDLSATRYDGSDLTDSVRTWAEDDEEDEDEEEAEKYTEDGEEKEDEEEDDEEDEEEDDEEGDEEEDYSYLDMRALFDEDDKTVYQPYGSTLYLLFQRPMNITTTPELLQFKPCSTIQFGTAEWTAMGCDRTEPPLGFSTTVSATSEDEAEDDEEEYEEDAMDGDDFSFIRESGGPDWEHNNRQDPDKPDGGGWRVTQGTLFDGREQHQQGATLESWNDTASVIGVDHDTDFWYCEHVEFTFLNNKNGTDTGNTIVFRQLLVSALIRFVWSSNLLSQGYLGMRITSPCPANSACYALNGQVECVADDDIVDSNGIAMLPRKDYFAALNVTLEVADNVQLLVSNGE